MPAAFAAAWNAGDADALAALFEADAEFINVVGLWWHDRAAIRTAHAYGLEVIFPGSTLRVVRTRENVLSEAVVLVQALLSLTGQAAHGGTEAGDRRTVISFVMRRDADGWLCAAAHNTDVVPGAETFVRTEAGLRPADYRPKG